MGLADVNDALAALDKPYPQPPAQQALEFLPDAVDPLPVEGAQIHLNGGDDGGVLILQGGVQFAGLVQVGQQVAHGLYFLLAQAVFVFLLLLEEGLKIGVAQGLINLAEGHGHAIVVGIGAAQQHKGICRGELDNAVVAQKSLDCMDDRSAVGGVMQTVVDKITAGKGELLLQVLPQQDPQAVQLLNLAVLGGQAGKMLFQSQWHMGVPFLFQHVSPSLHTTLPKSNKNLTHFTDSYH